MRITNYYLFVLIVVFFVSQVTNWDVLCILYKIANRLCVIPIPMKLKLISKHLNLQLCANWKVMWHRVYVKKHASLTVSFQNKYLILSILKNNTKKCIFFFLVINSNFVIILGHKFFNKIKNY